MKDYLYMKRCLYLAQKGAAHVSPNPMVGCVIVYNDKIIGEGYHVEYGKAHAEVNTINSVKDKELLKKSTLYVNLEPCSHYGKTPPCTDLIIKYEIPHVVIASLDVNKNVSGNGVKKLMQAACKTEVGLLDKENRFLNRRFFTFHQKKRPYIILKWAETQDGFIDRIRNKQTEASPNWITAETSRVLVHKQRTEEDAIMVGTNTARLDNPMLTARDWKGKNPLRILVDRNLSLPTSLKIFNKESQSIIFNTLKEEKCDNVHYMKIKFDEDTLVQLLKRLYDQNIMSLIVEGGTQLLNSFINLNLWDEATVYKGNKYYKQGVKAPDFNFKPSDVHLLGKDKLSIYYNTVL